MSKTRYILLVVVCLLLAVGLAGCTSKNKTENKTENKTSQQSSVNGDNQKAGRSPVEPLKPPVKVKMGIIAGSIGGAGYYIADAKGYFKDVGIDMEFIPFDTATKIIPLLATNQIDVASGAISAGLFNSVNDGANIKVISGIDSLSPDHGFLILMVRKGLIDSGQVKTIKDLKGLNVAATGNGSLTMALVDRALNKEKLALKDVNLQFMGFGNMLAAFANKAIDAATMNEPTATSAEEKGLAVKFLTGDKITPNEQMGILQASPNFVANKELAGRFMMAYLKGVRDYNDAFFKNKNKEEIINIFIDKLPIKDRKVYDKMVLPYLSTNGEFNLEGIGKDIDWFYDNKQIKAKPDVNKFFDSSISDWAVSKIGKYEK